MAPTIPTSAPAVLTAGETLEWYQSAPDTPASDGWTLTVYVVGPTEATATGVADGDRWQVTFAASVTTDWPAGTYRIVARASKAGAVHAVATSVLDVAADPADATGGSQQFHVERALAAVRARRLELLADNVVDYTVGQRSARRRELLELAREERRLTFELARLRGGTIQTIRHQFGATPRGWVGTLS